MRVRLPLTATILMILLFAVGCEQNVDPKDPEGAYNLYVNAVWANDTETVWNRVAPSTHEYFQERYEVLTNMDSKIEKYLPPTDHKIAREQAGSILTSKVSDGRGLFIELFKPSNLKLEEKHKVGAVVDQIKINEDETAAELTTLGGDVFYLTRGASEEWFIMLVRSSEAVDGRMAWLAANESALDQTVQDLIDEERSKREAIIEELMRLAPSEPPAEQEAPTDDSADGGQKEDSGNIGD